MKFSFTHITDIHLGTYQGNVEAGGLNSRFVDFVKTYDEAIDYTISNGNDFCLITGDIFKEKSPEPYQFDAFSVGIKKLLDKKIPVIIVLGNHDLFLSHKLKNSISVLKTLNLDNLHISSEPELIYLDLNGGKVGIQTMPYQVRHLLNMKTHEEVAVYIENNINELYEKADKKVPLVFAGHFSITDAISGTEQRSVNKFSEPIVSKHIFKNKNYVYVAMGHLHRYQVIMKIPPVVYGGSLNRIDFNEWKEDKGFVHCTYDDKLEYKFVKVNAKKFLDLEYNIPNEQNPEEYVLNDLKSKEAELKDTIVRISVTLNESNRINYSVKTITDYLNEHCSYIQGSVSPHILRGEALAGGEYNEYMSSMDTIKKYCESNTKIENKTLFLKLAEEIIKQGVTNEQTR